MLKRRLVISAFILSIGLGFFACEKEELNQETRPVQVNENHDDVDNNLSLRAFINSLETDAEKNNFLRLPLIDNRAIEQDRSEGVDGGEEESDDIPSRPMRVFRGFKFYPDNICTGHVISYCGSMGSGLIPDPDYANANVHAVTPDKLKLDFDTNETGFTYDGYLPLNSDISINPDAAAELGIPASSYIIAGIYTAEFDPTVGYYNSVTVDIMW